MIKTAPLLALAAIAAFAQTGDLAREIEAQERHGLDCLKTGDLKEFAATTADDAIFIDAHGPAGKAEVVEHTSQFRLDSYAMTDVKLLPLSPDSGVLTYKMTETGTSHGKQFSATVYVSSIWALRKDKWQCLFSQETGAR